MNNDWLDKRRKHKMLTKESIANIIGRVRVVPRKGGMSTMGSGSVEFVAAFTDEFVEACRKATEDKEDGE